MLREAYLGDFPADGYADAFVARGRPLGRGAAGIERDGGHEPLDEVESLDDGTDQTSIDEPELEPRPGRGPRPGRTAVEVEQSATRPGRDQPEPAARSRTGRGKLLLSGCARRPRRHVRGHRGGAR